MVSVAALRMGRLGWPAEARPGRRRGPHLAEAVWPATDLTRQILNESENPGLAGQVTMRYPVSGVDRSCLGGQLPRTGVMNVAAVS